MNEDSILSTIRKLLRLSENNPSAEEAALALAKAQQLMMRHQIESLDLQEKPEPDEFNKHFVGEPFNRLSSADNFISRILKNHFHVKVLYSRVFVYHGAYSTIRVEKIDRLRRKLISQEIPEFAFKPKGKRGMQLIGRKNNLLIAEYVFEFLRWEFERLWQQHQHETGKGACAKVDFFEGLYHGLDERLRDERRREERHMPSDERQKFAIVTADEDKALADYLHREFPNVRHVGYSQHTRGDVDSYAQGKTAGQSLNIRPAVNERRGTKLLK